MATLKDIANKCNTSPATVSYVLSGKGAEKRISPETQKAILRVAEELDYNRKIHSKDSLKRRVIIYFPLNSLEMLMPSYVEGIHKAVDVETANVDLIMRPYEQGQLNLQKDLWTATNHSAAVIISPNGMDLANLTETQTSMPVVLVNRTLPNYSSVTFDQLVAARLAAAHAIKKGGSDIALVLSESTRPEPLFGTSIRGKAFSDYCLNNGIDISGSSYYSQNDINAGYETGMRMIREGKLKKVIVCVYDMVALGIASALNESGYTVGIDVEIIATSSSNSNLLRHCYPPMTVVDLHSARIAQLAVHLAFDIVSDRASYPQDISVPPELIFRKSCPEN